ncbi:unnamed protein product [Amoebophrya sp. A120]|nr:unnamed protein product [Amoebophrya sp. A120]|eukprot:GSA120T00002546001.1
MTRSSDEDSSSESGCDQVELLVGMGFGPKAAGRALREARYDFDAALDMLEKEQAKISASAEQAGNSGEDAPKRRRTEGVASQAGKEQDEPQATTNEICNEEDTAVWRSYVDAETEICDWEDGLRLWKGPDRKLLLFGPADAVDTLARRAAQEQLEGRTPGTLQPATRSSGEEKRFVRTRLAAALPAVGTWKRDGTLALEPISDFALELFRSTVPRRLTGTSEAIDNKIPKELHCGSAVASHYVEGCLAAYRSFRSVFHGLRAQLKDDLERLTFRKKLAGTTNEVVKGRDDAICWIDLPSSTASGCSSSVTSMKFPALQEAARWMEVFAVQQWREWGYYERKNKHQSTLLRPARAMVARYPGNGARYVTHRDNECHLNHRALTVILYLSDDCEAEPWDVERDGGQLRAYTGPTGDGNSLSSSSTSCDAFTSPESPHVDIAPEFGTMACFRADLVPHEVRRAYRERTALTMWFLDLDVKKLPLIADMK